MSPRTNQLDVCQGLVSLIYSTVIICCVHVSKTLGLRIWRVSAILCVPGDLAIMGICLAKITILSFSGLPADCHGLTRDNCQCNPIPRPTPWAASRPCISFEAHRTEIGENWTADTTPRRRR